MQDEYVIDEELKEHINELATKMLIDYYSELKIKHYIFVDDIPLDDLKINYVYNYILSIKAITPEKKKRLLNLMNYYRFTLKKEEIAEFNSYLVKLNNIEIIKPNSFMRILNNYYDKKNHMSIINDDDLYNFESYFVNDEVFDNIKESLYNRNYPYSIKRFIKEIPILFRYPEVINRTIDVLNHIDTKHSKEVLKKVKEFK